MDFRFGVRKKQREDIAEILADFGGGDFAANAKAVSGAGHEFLKWFKHG